MKKPKQIRPAPVSYTHLKINEDISGDPVEKVLDHYLKLYKEENITGLPVVSGAFGYLSYDFGRKFEKIPCRHEKTLKIPDAVFAFYDLSLIHI